MRIQSFTSGCLATSGRASPLACQAGAGISKRLRLGSSPIVDDQSGLQMGPQQGNELLICRMRQLGIAGRFIAKRHEKAVREAYCGSRCRGNQSGARVLTISAAVVATPKAASSSRAATGGASWPDSTSGSSSLRFA